MNWIVKIEDNKLQRITVSYKPFINTFVILGQVKSDMIWTSLVQKECSSEVTLEELVIIFDEVINELNLKLAEIIKWNDIFKNKLSTIKIVDEE